MRPWLIFYRTVAFPLLLITLVCAGQVLFSGSPYFVFRVFWVKVFTSALLATYTVLFDSTQFIFYNNLGFSRSSLLVITFLFDFGLWCLAMILVSLAL